MKRSTLTPLLIFILVITLGYWLLKKEGYTSPGTMVQLATSHVPTREDEEYYRKVYPAIVRRDITDLTGEDPGPEPIPMPQLFE